nr:hypothetical protein [Tanacetum cinerariifolium]
RRRRHAIRAAGLSVWSDRPWGRVYRNRLTAGSQRLCLQSDGSAGYEGGPGRTPESSGWVAGADRDGLWVDRFLGLQLL